MNWDSTIREKPNGFELCKVWHRIPSPIRWEREVDIPVLAEQRREYSEPENCNRDSWNPFVGFPTLCATVVYLAAASRVTRKINDYRFATPFLRL
jgi:hypothetical protein